MNEQKNNGRGIFYGVIGVATLVVAIIGATFAYFTATASNNIITGNMATVSLNLAVTKVTTVDETKGGMIPMSNGMVEAAINNTNNDVCVDDNGNAVCQVYKITLTNNSSAGQFVDGYVALRGGSGLEPTDYTTYVDGAKYQADGTTANNGPTMRWAQVFASGAEYTTAGDQILGADTEKVTLTAIGQTKDAEDQDPHNTANIRDLNVLTSDSTVENASTKGVLSTLSIAGTTYNVIGKNYIRVSNHAWKNDGTAESYDRTADVTSALVYNHSIAPNTSVDYYVVVWLSETGTNQTAGAATGDSTTNPAALNFFNGNVTFVSAQGSEVSATFTGFSRVASNT